MRYAVSVGLSGVAVLAGLSVFGADISQAGKEPDEFELASSALRLSVKRADMSLTVSDLRTGRTWKPSAPSAPRLTFRSAKSDGRRLSFGVTDDRNQELSIAYELDAKAPGEFTVTIGGRGETKGFSYPAPFAGEKGDWLVLPQSEGFRLPMCEKSLPIWHTHMWSPYCCMAFFGVEDAEGAGWMAIAETRNDARVNLVKRADHAPLAAGPSWAPERGRYGPPRVVRYVFLDRGGYVAMAKRYRRAAQRQGLVKTFREKAKERPNVDRLLGAANVWYSGWGGPPPEKMLREMNEAGIDRVLWSSIAAMPSNQVAAIAAMPGALVGRYDIYRDVYTPDMVANLNWKWDRDRNFLCNTSAWPDDVIWNSADSNDVRKAWGMTCKDGKRRNCAAQCALRQPANARNYVSWDLRRDACRGQFRRPAVPSRERADGSADVTRRLARVRLIRLSSVWGSVI